MTESGEAMQMDKWFIVHTRARWEKKVADSLEQKGIESYCPVKKVQRKWSDRVKTIQEPLFKSHVFVRISIEQKADVRTTEGVINFTYQNGKPAQIKERQIKTLRKLLEADEIFELAKRSLTGKATDRDPATRNQKTLLAYFNSVNSF